MSGRCAQWHTPGAVGRHGNCLLCSSAVASTRAPPEAARASGVGNGRDPPLGGACSLGLRAAWKAAFLRAGRHRRDWRARAGMARGGLGRGCRRLPAAIRIGVARRLTWPITLWAGEQSADHRWYCRGRPHAERPGTVPGPLVRTLGYARRWHLGASAGPDGGGRGRNGRRVRPRDPRPRRSAVAGSLGGRCPDRRLAAGGSSRGTAWGARCRDRSPHAQKATNEAPFRTLSGGVPGRGGVRLGAPRRTRRGPRDPAPKPCLKF